MEKIFISSLRRISFKPTVRYLSFEYYLNTSFCVIQSLGDPAIKFPSILEKINVKFHKNFNSKYG